LNEVESIDLVTFPENGFSLFKFIVMLVGLVNVLLLLGKGLEHDAVFHCASLAIRVDPSHVVEIKR
jgi:hypothetical protein